MASKSGQGIKSKMPEGKVSIKYVKRAKMWCRTWFEGIQQKQEWSVEKPNE